MNLTALEREIARTEEKIEAYREKVRALKQRKLGEENAQIIKLVRAANMSIADLQEMFAPAKPQNKKMEEERDV